MMNEAFSSAFHSTELSEKDFENGNTRFQSWHMDGPGYRIDPPWFSSFRTIKLPVGPDQTINWDDGSGLSMKAKPGRTAFFNTAQMYNLLSEDEKNMADHSWVEYMHYPYEWIRDCHGQPNGLGAACEGREVPMNVMDKLPRDPAWTRKVRVIFLDSGYID
jgi:xanthine dioxygenase